MDDRLGVGDMDAVSYWDTPAWQADKLWAKAREASSRATSPEDVARIEARLREDLAAIGQAYRYST